MDMILALAAMLAELATGYPQRIFRRIGHPVSWIGAGIAAADRNWNRERRTPAARFAAGALLVVLLLAGSVAIGLAFEMVLALSASGTVAFLAIAIAMGTLIAQRSLHDHVLAVAEAMETEGLEAGRQALSLVVGRDTQALDGAGVVRAAIESLAENFSDGVVAPVVWLAVAGPAGAIAYKAVNTADSMIGHRTARHEAFGKAAARLDDLINLPASRLAAVLIALAALVQPGARCRDAIRTVMRDARQHRSPNAGWPEAAVAGALGIRLSGPRVYGGVPSSDAAINAGGRANLVPADIHRALALYRRADALLIGLLALGAVLQWAL
ncbi:MAG: cobalamin biosynthesis protein CobD [Alphaproteobacteria bacterium]|nr:cobalamin biosynthesis protein CobD [Alphaproteobacteria bacterium]MCB9931771.1 cobalamin biosynthesis protein CobD [Alphaproteobacteria bacterium]